MKTLELKLTRIGKSKGIRLPTEVIKQYGFAHTVVAEPRPDGLLLHPSQPLKLSWEETAKAMAAVGEDWSEWEGTLADGLDETPWQHPIPGGAVGAKKTAK